jgi:hypothetical protein
MHSLCLQHVTGARCFSGSCSHKLIAMRVGVVTLSRSFGA